mgnify:CR=1 FL=1
MELFLLFTIFIFLNNIFFYFIIYLFLKRQINEIIKDNL